MSTSGGNGKGAGKILGIMLALFVLFFFLPLIVSALWSARDEKPIDYTYRGGYVASSRSNGNESPLDH